VQKARDDGGLPIAGIFFQTLLSKNVFFKNKSFFNKNLNLKHKFGTFAHYDLHFFLQKYKDSCCVL